MFQRIIVHDPVEAGERGPVQLGKLHPRGRLPRRHDLLIAFCLGEPEMPVNLTE